MSRLALVLFILVLCPLTLLGATSDSGHDCRKLLRRMQPADLPQILAINAKVPSGDRWTKKDLSKLIEGQAGNVIVATSPEGDVLGYVIYQSSAAGTRIQALAVHPKYRDKKVLEALLNRGGMHWPIRIDVSEDNVPVLVALRDHGFWRLQTIKGGGGKGRDLHRFEFYPSGVRTLVKDGWVDSLGPLPPLNEKQLDELAEQLNAGEAAPVDNDRARRTLEHRPYIRWLIRRDMPGVVANEKRHWGRKSWIEEDFLRALRERNTVGMVLEDGDKVIAHMVYELHQSSIALINFSADPRYAKEAALIKLAMINKLKGKLTEHRRTGITIPVRKSDRVTRRFLKGTEFNTVKIIKDYFPDGEDAYVMHYQLPGSQAVPIEIGSVPGARELTEVEVDPEPVEPHEPATPPTGGHDSGPIPEHLSQFDLNDLMNKLIPPKNYPDVASLPKGKTAEVPDGRVPAAGPLPQKVSEAELQDTINALLHENPPPEPLPKKPATSEMTGAQLAETLANEARAHHGYWVSPDFLEELGKNHPRSIAMVATSPKGAVVGYAVCDLASNRLKVLHLAVNPLYQRAGMESAMVEGLIESLRLHKKAEIEIDVDERDSESQIRLQGQGFKAVRVLRNYFADGGSAFRMRYASPDGPVEVDDGHVPKPGALTQITDDEMDALFHGTKDADQRTAGAKPPKPMKPAKPKKPVKGDKETLPVSIDPIAPEDQRAFIENETRAWKRNAWTEADLMKAFIEHEALAMVAHGPDGRMVGQIVFSYPKSATADFRILRVSVDPDYSRQGVGTQLVQDLIDRLNATGRRRILVDVPKENKAALEFFKSLGFRESGNNGDAVSLIYERNR